MDLEGLEGLDSFTLARVAQIEAKRRAVMQPLAPPPAPTPDGVQDADQAGRARREGSAGSTEQDRAQTGKEP